MTKEQYLLVRDKEEIPMEIWYEYYLEKGGKDIGLATFTDVFVKMSMGLLVTNTKRQPKFISFNTALDAFYKYYNQKFNV